MCVTGGRRRCLIGTGACRVAMLLQSTKEVDLSVSIVMGTPWKSQLVGLFHGTYVEKKMI